MAKSAKAARKEARRQRRELSPLAWFGFGMLGTTAAIAVAVAAILIGKPELLPKQLRSGSTAAVGTTDSSVPRVLNLHPVEVQEPTDAERVRLQVQCADDPASDCAAAEPLCGDETAAAVRRACPLTCGTCMGTKDKSEQGRLHSVREKVVSALNRATAASGPTPSAKLSHLVERLPVLIVDDFLPESVMRRSVHQLRESGFWQAMAPKHKPMWASPDGVGAPRDARGLFHPPERADGFPGLGTVLPRVYEESAWARMHQLRLQEAFAPLLSVPLRMAWSSLPFAGLLCLSPDALHMAQQAPHVDQTGQMGGEPQLAILHYLSNWSASGEAATGDSGGTSFYAERATGESNFVSARCDALVERTSGKGSFFCKGSAVADCERGRRQAAECTGVPAASIRSPLRPGYQSEADEAYELLKVVPYVYNRAVIYSAKQLHNSYTDRAALEALSCDPREGRLTANMFIF